MFKSKKNGKITKYKRYSFFNIGTLLFSIVFIYLIICIFMYLTESHITAYEVTRGSITGNYRFHAFSLRDLVSLLFGNMTWLSRVVYTLVGISGMYLLSLYGRVTEMGSEQMYLDSFLKISLTDAATANDLLRKLDKISEKFGVTFVISISLEGADIAEDLKKYMIAEL